MTCLLTDSGSAMGAGDGSKMFEFEVGTTYPKENGRLRLVSIAPERHMNVVITPDRIGQETITLSAEDARKVRDALIRAYPIEPAKPEPSEYKVGHGYSRKWYVYQEEQLACEKVYAADLTQDNAKKIAKALNEAEGL